MKLFVKQPCGTDYLNKHLILVTNGTIDYRTDKFHLSFNYSNVS